MGVGAKPRNETVPARSLPEPEGQAAITRPLLTTRADSSMFDTSSGESFCQGAAAARAGAHAMAARAPSTTTAMERRTFTHPRDETLRTGRTVSQGP